jgi:hypothetical protein
MALFRLVCVTRCWLLLVGLLACGVVVHTSVAQRVIIFHFCVRVLVARQIVPFSVGIQITQLIVSLSFGIHITRIVGSLALASRGS